MKRKWLARKIDSILMGSFSLQILALVVVTVLVTIVGTFLVITAWRYTFPDALWWSFLRVTDFSTLYYEAFPLGRVFGSIAAISGWVVFGLLISIITTSIQTRLNELQKGRLGFDATGHTAIFGWNQTIYSVLDEFTALRRVGDAPVVLMSNRTAEQMYNDIRSFCQPGTVDRVVCRMGNPESVADQKRINVNGTREVIVLNSGLNTSSITSDASALKTLLAYVKNLSDSKEKSKSGTKKTSAPRNSNVIVELSQASSLELIKGLLPALWKPGGIQINFFPILTVQVIGKLLSRCAVQPGLSIIYQDLFSYKDIAGFESNTEIYIVPLSRTGLDRETCFEELIFALPGAAAIGYVKEGADPVLNPAHGSRESRLPLHPRRDSVICIAESEEQVVFSPCEEVHLKKAFAGSGRLQLAKGGAPLNIMVLGVGKKASVAVNEFIKNAPPGSKITCSETLRQGALAPVNAPSGEKTLDYWNMRESHLLLSSLCTSKVLEYDIVVFAEDIVDAANHDALSLMLLAGINAACRNSDKRPRIVMDLFDHNNVELAQTANADDVIIGAEVASNYLLQVAISPLRYYIFTEILSCWGTEIELKPAELYTGGDKPVSFEEVMKAARLRHELAFGYTFCVNGEEKIVLNPAFEKRTALREDMKKIVILTEKFLPQ